MKANTINRRDIIKEVSSKAGVTQKSADAILGVITSLIIAGLKDGKQIAVAGFGSLKPKTRSARTCRNPKTGAQIQVAAKNTVAFKPHKAMKDALV